MIRTLRFTGITLVAFVILLAADTWLRRHGFIAASVLHDWGEAVLYGDGKGTFHDFATTYPPVAFTLGLILGVPSHEFLPLPPPAAASALLAALLIAKWVSTFIEAQYGAWSLVLAAMLCLHPFFLYSATTGVSSVLLLITIYWFATAYCASHCIGRVTDFMNLGLALAFMAFVHPLGALICVIALPFLGFALPSVLMARSAFNSLLMLLFPLLFVLISFTYENALFEDNATAFLSDAFLRVQVVVQLGNTAAGTPFGPFSHAYAFIIATLTLAAAMPAAIMLVSLRRRATKHTEPVAALTVIAFLAVVAAGAVAITQDEAASLASLPDMAAPFMALAAVATRHWPLENRRRGTVAAMLLAGVVGGWGVSLLWQSGEPVLWRKAAMGALVRSEQDGGAATLGRYLSTRADVLIDAHAHPEVLAARGNARGLIVPGDDSFTLTMLTRQIHSRFVAVPDSDLPAILNDDLLAQTFPSLYCQGMEGYRLTYDANGWRVYERTDLHYPI